MTHAPVTTRRRDGAASTTADLVRRIGVTLALVLCYLGTVAGFGLIGSPVEDSSGGALSADATLLAPASTAFSIWSVIYLGLLAYTVWQWLPARATDARARATGWLAAASMVLNAAWIGTTQVGWLWASVAVILALVVVLGLLVARLGRGSSAGDTDASWFERIAVDGTFGLYLGWVTIATCANITAVLVADGFTFGQADPWIAVAVLAVATVIGIVLALRLGGRWAVAAALAWGLAWIGVGRLAGEPASALVGIAALVAAAVVLAAHALVRFRRPSATQQAAQERRVG